MSIGLLVALQLQLLILSTSHFVDIFREHVVITSSHHADVDDF